MIIFLIGFMGSGKSTIGKRLANQLGYSFIDSDSEIQKITGKSISEIFESEGEDGFRLHEKEWIEGIDFDNAVIALGGGTPCFNNMMFTIKQKGLTVYLKLPVKALTYRLIQSKTKRPLIDNLKSEPVKLEETILNMLDSRSEYYNQSHIKFNANSMSKKKIEDLIEEINQLMN